jgi:hypothetical protein
MVDIVAGSKSSRKQGEETRDGVVVLAIAVTSEQGILGREVIVETNIEVVVVGDAVANDEEIVDYARCVGRIVSGEVLNSRRILPSGWDDVRDPSGDELRAGRWIEDGAVVWAGIEDRLSIRCCRAVRNSARRRTCYWCNLKLSNDLTLGNL